MQESDVFLIKGCRTGDISAFDRLVIRHRKQMYQLAYRITGNHEDADDISQEAFIRAYKSIGSFRGKSKIVTWLRRIVINLSINHLKKESRRREPSNEGAVGGEVDSPVSGVAHNPLANIEADELVQRIKEAEDSLPVSERIVFVLRVHQGLSYKEMARTLNCPVGTVMSRLNRARRRLRDNLKDYVI